jgi:hypothetical protein
MNIELEDQSVLLRKIEQHRLREQNLSSLPSLDQTSDYEGSDEEENRVYFEELKRKNRAARETEELEKENIGRDFDGEVSVRLLSFKITDLTMKLYRTRRLRFRPGCQRSLSLVKLKKFNAVPLRRINPSTGFSK